MAAKTLVLCFLGVAHWLLPAAETSTRTRAPQEVAEPAEEIMWRKLDLAHDVLDALAVEDYEALIAYGEDLRSLSYAGDWYVSDTEAYRTRSAAFRAAATALTASARRGDIKGAARANIELILTCVRCHHELGALPR